MEAISAPQPSYSPLSGFTDIVRSELWKFRTVRSTYWTLFLAVLFNVALAALAAIFIPGQLSAHDKATFDSTRVSLGGIHLSQIAFGVLGVLIITSEYSTGLIRTTLSAVPQRRQVLAAKVTVFTTTALTIGIVSSFAAYLVFQGLLTDSSLRTSISDPGVLRAVTGGGLFLTVLGLLGLGLGAIIRASAGSIAAVFGLVFVPQILVQLLPTTWKAAIGPYVPMQAGSAIFSVRPEAGALAPWTGFAVFCLYAAVALTVAFILINRRDA